MDNATIKRYQPGGDIYAQLVAQFGTASANAIAQAALTGDRGQVANAIENAKGIAAAPSTGFWGQLGTQLANDPLGAPIDSLNNQLSRVFMDILKNPFVLVGIGLLIFFFVFDGLSILRGRK
ncbi:MAG TPA: hypothetical protein VN516_09450 [Candidatus Baltobacteraceae bacterium]|nr:hypothetical protein [Candidatus Baltobacteraceae bacterium]